MKRQQEVFALSPLFSLGTAAPYQRLSRTRSELMGFAMIWVMLFHAYGLTFRFRPLNAFRQVGYSGVDIFLLLSAMGIYVSLSRANAQEGRGGLGRFYARRLIRVLPAFWLVAGAYSLFLVQKGRIGWDTLLWNLSALYYWFQIPGTFNWYIPALLAFYLLAPFYVKLFRRCPDNRKALLTAASLPLSYLLYRIVARLGLSFFVCRLPAFAMGVLLGHYLVSGQPFTRRHAAAWGAFSLAGLLAYFPYAAGKVYFSPSYLTASQLVPLCLLLSLVLEKLPNRVRALLRLLGECSLEIYLFNVVLTREFDLLAPCLNLGPRHRFYYLVVDSANLLLGIGLHELLSRLLPSASGAPALNQKPQESVSYSSRH